MIVNCEFFVITLYEFHLEATGIQISILYFKCNHFKAHEAFPMMATELNARFGRALSEEEIEERINETISKKSLSKASWAVKIFKNWLSHRQSQGIINGLHVFKPLEEMSAAELDSQLRYFVFEVRKVNGEFYPANTLRDIFQGIGFHLKNVMKRDWRIFSDREFKASRDALNSAMIMANRKKVEPQGGGPSIPLSYDNEEKLWNTGILGCETPKQLIRTVFVMTGKFFGLRGGHEHRNLEWGRDITLQQTEMGEALVYINRSSKNNAGGLKERHIAPKQVKAFENSENPSRCLIKIYKLYAEKRKTIENTAFYLKPREKFGEEWFVNSPIGHNTLATMMKNIAEAGGLQGRFLNHSLKKTTATHLRGMSEAQRRAQTGNRSSSLQNYEIVNDEDFRETSAVLYGNHTANRSTYVTKSRVQHLKDNISICDERLEIQSSSSKKMKIEMDGEKNKVTVTFE